MSDKIEAIQVVEDACRELDIKLADLIALTGFWVHPDVVARVAGPRHPNRRRANLGLRVEGKQVEFVGQVIDGVTLDNNTYANTAFKQALGVRRQNFIGFHVCHIWTGTAYDPQCFTHLANLVGIPADLASLSDHHPHISACLKYRAWELYRWRPATERFPPVKPADYPVRWREPLPVVTDGGEATGMLHDGLADNYHPKDEMDSSTELLDDSASDGPLPGRAVPQVSGSQATGTMSESNPLVSRAVTYGARHSGVMPASERAEVIAKIRLWATKPHSKVYKMIGLVVRTPVALQRQQLARKVEATTGSKNASGAIASLLTSAGNAYGRVLIDIDGAIYLHPDVKDEVLAHAWS